MISRSFCRIVLGLLLCWPAILNHFPFIWFDSLTYIVAAHQGLWSDFRSVFYPIWIYFSSTPYGLWSVILLQSFWLSCALLGFVRCFFPQGWRPLVIVLFTVLLTPIAFFCSWIMPDVFTSAMWMSGVIYIVNYDRLSWISKRGWILSLLLASLIHFSNHLIGGLSLLVFLICTFLLRELRRYRTPGVHVALMLLVVAPSLYWTLSFTHQLPKESPRPWIVLLLARAVADGRAVHYLEQNCAPPTWSLCPYIEDLKKLKGLDDFIWSPRSPFQKMGGFRKAPQDFSDIVIGIWSTDLKRSIGLLFLNTQQMMIKSMDFQAPTADVGSSEQIVLDLAEMISLQELVQLKSSQQVNGEFPSWMIRHLRRLRPLQNWAVVFLAVMVFIRRREPHILATGILFFAFYFINAFLMANLSAPAPRYQGRFVWLAVPLLLIFVASMKRPRREAPSKEVAHQIAAPT